MSATFLIGDPFTEFATASREHRRRQRRLQARRRATPVAARLIAQNRRLYPWVDPTVVYALGQAGHGPGSPVTHAVVKAAADRRIAQNRMVNPGETNPGGAALPYKAPARPLNLPDYSHYRKLAQQEASQSEPGGFFRDLVGDVPVVSTLASGLDVTLGTDKAKARVTPATAFAAQAGSPTSAAKIMRLRQLAAQYGRTPLDPYLQKGVVNPLRPVLQGVTMGFQVPADLLNAGVRNWARRVADSGLFGEVGPEDVDNPFQYRGDPGNPSVYQQSPGLIALKRLVAGEPIRTGQGLLPDPTIKTGPYAVAGRFARQEAPTIQGHGFTLGRYVANQIVPGDETAFNVMSGVIDAAIATKFDPTNAITGTVAQGLRERGMVAAPRNALEQQAWMRARQTQGMEEELTRREIALEGAHGRLVDAESSGDPAEVLKAQRQVGEAQRRYNVIAEIRDRRARETADLMKLARSVAGVRARNRPGRVATEVPKGFTLDPREIDSGQVLYTFGKTSMSKAGWKSLGIPESEIDTYKMSTGTLGDLPAMKDYDGQPLVAYHTTTGLDAVLAEGLRPSEETGRAALGGTKAGTVSVSYDLNHSRKIESTFKAVIDAAKDPTQAKPMTPAATMERMVTIFEDAEGGAVQVNPEDVVQALAANGIHLERPMEQPGHMDPTYGWIPDQTLQPTPVEWTWDSLDEAMTKQLDAEGKDNYDIVQALDRYLPRYVPGSHDPSVTLLMKKADYAALDPSQIGTLAVAIRKDAKPGYINPGETELSFRPNDLVVVDPRVAIKADWMQRAGLMTAFRRWVNPKSVTEWMNTKDAAPVVSKFVEAKDAVDVARMLNWEGTPGLWRSLARASNPDEVMIALDANLGLGLSHYPTSKAMETNSIIGSRRGEQMPHSDASIDPSRTKDSAIQADRWLANALVPAAERNRLVNRILNTNTYREYMDTAKDMMTAAGRQMRAKGAPPRIVQKLTELVTDIPQGVKQYWWDADLRQPGDFPFAFHDPVSGIPMPTPMAYNEMLHSGISLPNAREIRGAMYAMHKGGYWITAQADRWDKLASQAREAGDHALARSLEDKAQTWRQYDLRVNGTTTALAHGADHALNFWKRMKLFRAAWGLRVVGEEQLRMWAYGVTSLASHPMRSLSVLAGSTPDSRLGKAVEAVRNLEQRAANVPIIGRPIEALLDPQAPARRYVQDLLHQPFAGGLFDEGLNQRFSDLIAFETVRADRNPIAHVWHPAYKGAREYPRAIAEEILRLYKDPVMGPLAGKGAGAAVEWLTHGGGQPFWKEMTAPGRNLRIQPGGAIRKSETLTPGEYAQMTRWYVDAAQQRVLQLADGDRSIIDAIVSGTLDGIPLDDALESRAGLDHLVARIQSRTKGGWGPEQIRAAEPIFEKGAKSMGAKGLTQMFDHFMYQLMPRPSNYLSRSPMIRQVYWNRVHDLMPYMGKTAQRRAIKSAEAAGLHPQDLERLKAIEPMPAAGITLEQAHEYAMTQAVDETRKLLYDLSEKGQLVDQLRFVFPFAEAWKEVLTRWAKLVWQNPRVPRRLTQGIMSARQSGFLTKDPITGQEVFTFPGSGFLTQHLLSSGAAEGAATGAPMGALGGFFLGGPVGGAAGAAAGAGLGGALGHTFLGEGGPPVPVPFFGSLQGLNIVSAGIPGVGPAVSISLPYLTHLVGIDINEPKWDTLTNLIYPYGRSDTGAIDRDLLDQTLPGFAATALRMFRPDSTQMQSAFNYGMNSLAASGDYHLQGPDANSEWNRLQKDAGSFANRVMWFRAFQQFFAPTAPMPRWVTRIPEGAARDSAGAVVAMSKFQRGLLGMDEKWVEQTVLAQHYNERRQRDGEDSAYNWLLKNFGAENFLVSSPFTKTNAFTPRTKEGWDFVAERPWLRDLFPETYGLIVPENPKGTFDITNYYLALRRGERTYQTPRQRLEQANGRLASFIYDNVAKEAGLNPTDAQMKVLDNLETQLRNEFPGYHNRSPDFYAVDRRIREITDMVNDKRVLADPATARIANTVKGYLKMRETAQATAQEMGYVSYTKAKATKGLRDVLRNTAAALVQAEPGFAPFWNYVFRRELPSEEDPGTLGTRDNPITRQPQDNKRYYLTPEGPKDVLMEDTGPKPPRARKVEDYPYLPTRADMGEIIHSARQLLPKGFWEKVGSPRIQFTDEPNYVAAMSMTKPGTRPTLFVSTSPDIRIYYGGWKIDPKENPYARNAVRQWTAQVLMHELGHAWARKFDQNDIVNYARIRGFPAGTPVDQVHEDFAEVLAYVMGYYTPESINVADRAVREGQVGRSPYAFQLGKGSRGYGRPDISDVARLILSGGHGLVPKNLGGRAFVRNTRQARAIFSAPNAPELWYRRRRA